MRSSPLLVRMKQKACVKIGLEKRSEKKGNGKNDFAKVVFLALPEIREFTAK